MGGRKAVKAAPTDEEILEKRTVTVELASRYIGMSNATLAWALRQERAPFGFAAHNQDTDTWSYNISPGLLVAYKRGTLPVYKLEEVIRLAAEGVERVLDAKMERMELISAAIDTALRP